MALLGAAGFHAFESGVNGNVKSFADSLWWTMVTMTTIGYGDVFPITTGGRLIALVLMFMGIGTLGVSTAAIAAYFVQGDRLQRLRLGRLRDHMVIYGLTRASLLLARAFCQRGFLSPARGAVAVVRDPRGHGRCDVAGVSRHDLPRR